MLYYSVAPHLTGRGTWRSRSQTLRTNPRHCHTPRRFTSSVLWSWQQNFHWLQAGGNQDLRRSEQAD